MKKILSSILVAALLMQSICINAVMADVTEYDTDIDNIVEENEDVTDSLIRQYEVTTEAISEDSTELTTETFSTDETETTENSEATTETDTTVVTEDSTETTTYYTIVFRSNGGSEVESITVLGGSKVEELPVPTREGYVFRGWFKDSYTFEDEFTSDDIVNSNMRLYAAWNPIITLTFDSNGGNAVEPVQVEAGKTTVLPSNVTKEGCTFGGWYSGRLWSEEYTDTTAAPAYDITLYAKWIKTMPTETEIRAKYNSLNLSSVSNKYAQTPNVTDPYSAGKLSDQFVSQGLDYLNFIRYIEGLQDVEIDNSLADTAQYGAVILAALGRGLSHSPSKPSDMSDDFYHLGYETASSSNLSAGTSSLIGSLQGQLDDEDSSNMDRVGHRRWLTHPYMKYTAFGFAENSSSMYRSYSSVWAFDESNEDVDFYDFIAYPAKGNFPTELINNTIPWSVSLNTALYKVGSVNDINVKITKKSTGKTWNISQADYSSNPSTGSKYFNYNTGGYGIGSCIIFSIGKNNISDGDFNGEFDVEITGLTDKDGNDTSINYTTNFFNLSNSSSGSSGSSGGSSGGGSGSGSSGGSSGGGGGGGGGGSISTKYFTVSFDSNGGSTVSSRKIALNSKLTKPADPSKSGYEFTGWYTNKDCTKEYDFDKKVTSTFTLYAGWKKISSVPLNKEDDKEEKSQDNTKETPVNTVTEKQETNSDSGITGVVKVTIGSRNVTVGNNTYTMDAAAYIQTSSSSTLVPLRFVAIALLGDNVMNADTSNLISWNAQSKTATIFVNNNAVSFTAGSPYMIINGNSRLMENSVRAEIVDSRMYIPFRALGTAMNVKVDWDSETKTAIYSKN